MKKVSKIKKVVVAVTLLFVVGAEMQAQDTIKMIEVYENSGIINYRKAISKIDSVVFVGYISGGGSVDVIHPISGFESTFEMVFVEGGITTLNGTQVLLNSFYIGKYEVTQGLWNYIMSDDRNLDTEYYPVYNPSFNANFGGASGDAAKDYAVYNVSWRDIRDCFLLRLKKITGLNFRLPTEAEWEYAARGGNVVPKYCDGGCRYAGSDTIGNVAWYNGNSGSSIHEVGGKAANELGLHDMSGNVYEWCYDWYTPTYPSSNNNPMGGDGGDSRLVRGGSWHNSLDICEISYRTRSIPSLRNNDYGFRLVLVDLNWD
jgi:formylglycine-generating enzyme required for sulfatase activity